MSPGNLNIPTKKRTSRGILLYAVFLSNKRPSFHKIVNYVTWILSLPYTISLGSLVSSTILEKSKRMIIRLLIKAQVHTSDGIGGGVGIGSTRSVTIQCKSKSGIGSGVGSSTESESEGREEFLFLPMPLPLPSLPIQWGQGERNRKWKRPIISQSQNSFAVRFKLRARKK